MLNKFDIGSLKKMDYFEKSELSKDIRRFLVNNISVTGGHLSSNLGVVEITIALHSILNSPQDKILFDVGHQSYTHKILTGRGKFFSQLRKKNGLSGFISNKESKHDIWESGHSSTSISAAIAYAITNPNKHVVVVIGDSSIVNGVSLEAINHLGELNLKNITIILNDNDMSISDSVGGFKKSLAETKINEITINTLSHFNVKYSGPYDGHNIELIETVLVENLNLEESCIIHLKTKKGKGFKKAEEDSRGIWHGVGTFSPNDSKVQIKSTTLPSWPEIISKHIETLMDKNEKITVTTPAMELGSCLGNIRDKYPKRFFDVGISEEHAIVFNSALSETKKIIPFLSIYSTFLQRGYDFLLTDLARKNNHVVIGIDRCGFVGPDGPTHHGLWDVSFLSTLPNCTIFHPLDSIEAANMLNYSFSQKNGLYAIRYSKNTINYNYPKEFINEISWTIIKELKEINIISYGRILKSILDDNRDDIGIINANILNKINASILEKLNNKIIIVIEEVVENNSLYEHLLKYIYINKLNINIIRIGVDNPFIEHSSYEEQLEESKLDIKSINKIINEQINHK